MQDTHCAEEIKFGRRQLLVGASLAGAIAALPKAAQAAQNAELANAAQAVTATRCPYGVGKLEHKYAVVSRPALDRLQELVGLGEVEQTETPVMRLFREWEAAFAASRAYKGKDEVEADRLYDVYIEIEDRMMAAKAETAQDVFAKVWAYTSGGKSNLPDIAHPVGEVFWSEAKAVLT